MFRRKETIIVKVTGIEVEAISETLIIVEEVAKMVLVAITNVVIKDKT